MIDKNVSDAWIAAGGTVKRQPTVHLVSSQHYRPVPDADRKAIETHENPPKAPRKNGWAAYWERQRGPT